MQADVRADLSWSSAAFLDLVWPVINSWCGGGEIIPVESTGTRTFNSLLDMHAGIDFWQICGHTGRIRGIASRIQVCPRPTSPYDTFTIRKQRDSGAGTEFAKRLTSIEEADRGWLYPALTVQAYISQPGGGELRSAAMVYTACLYRYIRDGVEGIGWYTERTSNAAFIVVPWARFSDTGVQFRSWHENGSAVQA